MTPAIFQTTRPLYLASGSPRRIDFLQELGLTATVLLPPAEAEPAPAPGEQPGDYAVRAALDKARGILPLVPPRHDAPPLIIAADTVVALGERILGKPRDAEDAFAMLRALAGNTHTVVTGCALLGLDATDASCTEQRCFSAASRVRMWDCPDAVLRAYARSGEPLDKAGAYAVQGAGAFLVERIEGSWSNVVGLPLAELVRALCDMDALAPL